MRKPSKPGRLCFAGRDPRNRRANSSFPVTRPSPGRFGRSRGCWMSCTMFNAPHAGVGPLRHSLMRGTQPQRLSRHDVKAVSVVKSRRLLFCQLADASGFPHVR